MITLTMATEVAAPRGAVWDAIIDPEQERHWRPGVCERLEDETIRGHTRHRYRLRLHDVPVLLQEERLAVLSPEKLHSELRLGLFRFEETFSLVASAPRLTRLGVRVAAQSRLPVVGGSLDRFDVRRLATDLAALTLQAVRDWCERDVAPGPALPDQDDIPGTRGPNDRRGRAARDAREPWNEVRPR